MMKDYHFIKEKSNYFLYKYPTNVGFWLQFINIRDAIRNVGKKLYYLHIADSNRAAPGRGHIDFEEIAQALKDIDYNGWISMELLPAAANPFSGIVQEEFYDQYTEESITYLKKLFS